MCTNPLKGFKHGTTENGKDNYIIRHYDVDHLEVLDNGRIINAYSPKRTASDKVIREFIEIPCGKCHECRLAYSRRWADRCMLEAQYHNENCFITLTYDDEHIPNDYGFDPITGERRRFNSLKKEDLQKFFKSLRNALNEIPKEKRDGKQRYWHEGDPDFVPVRYLACGEYGSKTSRPHYHIILFGWHPPETDIVPIGKNELGQDYYGSATLSKAWDKGFHVVGECDWNSCAYVSRYVTKKMFPMEKDFYEMCNIEPEFLVMSRRPGIGAQWYEDNKKCYSTFLKSYLKTKTGSHAIGSVKYFDNKLMNDYPEIYEDMKEKRVHFAKQYSAIQRKMTTLPYSEYLGVKNENLIRKTKALKGEIL